MTILRCENPHFAIMPNPAKRMLPNIIIVHPPSTAWGIVASTAPTNGNSPPRIRMTAPVAMVKRLTTFVMAARPTFCEKDVIGVQPKTPASVLTNPSQATELPISFLWTCRPSAPEHMAEVSPMVSVAETR